MYIHLQTKKNLFLFPFIPRSLVCARSVCMFLNFLLNVCFGRVARAHICVLHRNIVIFQLCFWHTHTHTIHEGRSISLGSNPALPIRHGATPTPGLRYKNLGKSGLRVSNVGLGTWPVFSPGVSEEQAEAILKLAVESGINMFDISEAHSGNFQKLFIIFTKRVCLFRKKIFFWKNERLTIGRIGTWQNHPEKWMETYQLHHHNENLLEHEVGGARSIPEAYHWERKSQFTTITVAIHRCCYYL